MTSYYARNTEGTVGKVLFIYLFMLTPKDPSGLLPLDELFEKSVC